MTLVEQLLSLGYHLIVGQLLGLIYSFFSLLLLSQSTLFRTCFMSIVSIVCTCSYYYGLYQINGGMMHIYSFLALGISFYIYYLSFYGILIPAFVRIKRFLLPFKRKMDFVKNKIYVIMEKRRKIEVKNEQKHKEKKIK